MGSEMESSGPGVYCQSGELNVTFPLLLIYSCEYECPKYWTGNGNVTAGVLPSSFGAIEMELKPGTIGPVPDELDNSLATFPRGAYKGRA